jgi:hypothetical protein
LPERDKEPGSGLERDEATRAVTGDRDQTRRAGGKRREWLGRSLRELYADTVKDPIPDTFRKLLDELERKDAQSEKKDGE